MKSLIKVCCSATKMLLLSSEYEILTRINKLNGLKECLLIQNLLFLVLNLHLCSMNFIKQIMIIMVLYCNFVGYQASESNKSKRGKGY